MASEDCICTKCKLKYTVTGHVPKNKPWFCYRCRPLLYRTRDKVLLFFVIIAIVGSVRCFFVYPLERIFLCIFCSFSLVGGLWGFSLLGPHDKTGYWKDKSTGRIVRAATHDELHPNHANYMRDIANKIKANGVVRYIYGLLKSWILFGSLVSLAFGLYYGWKSIILEVIAKTSS